MNRTRPLLALLLLMSAGAAQAQDTPTSLAARSEANTQLARGGNGVQTVPALRYVVLQAGPGIGGHPFRSSGVKVRYEGSLVDGTIFDSSYGKGDGTVIFPVRGVIPGFSAAVQMMRKGDVWRVYVPKELAYAYGSELAGKDLIFKIELVDFAELPPPKSPILTELPPH